MKCWNQPTSKVHKEQSRFCLTVGLFWLHHACRLSARHNDHALSSPRLLRRQKDGCTSQEPLWLQFTLFLELLPRCHNSPRHSDVLENLAWLFCLREGGQKFERQSSLQCLSLRLWLVKQDSYNHTKSYEDAFTVHCWSELRDKNRHLNHGVLLNWYLRTKMYYCCYMIVVMTAWRRCTDVPVRDTFAS